tara:strand:- start:389 stop:1165 length:777 start_codon:yes stop_codon:yes gene_type:complete
MADTPRRVTSKDILNGIMDRHSSEDWVCFSEVSQSTGAYSGRRADAVCMNLWPSKGLAIHGFEIKVSRADFMKEMMDITKAEAVGQYCDFWWLAVPSGLVDVTEIPDAWGLMVLHANGLKIKKQAPKRTPKDPTRGFMASLLRSGRDVHKPYIEQEIERRLSALNDQREKSEKRRREMTTSRNERAEIWIADFEKKLGCKFEDWQCPSEMAERLAVARSLKFGHVSRLMAACAGVVHEVGALGKAMPDGRLDEKRDVR